MISLVIVSVYASTITNADWESLGTKDPFVNGVVRTIAYGSDGYIYAGGDFHNSGSSSVNYIASYAHGSWLSFTEEPDSTVNTTVFDNTGRLFVGGLFSILDGSRVSKIGVRDNVGWSSLGSGMDGTVNSIAVDNENSLIYVGGAFSKAGDLVSPFISRCFIGNHAPVTSGIPNAVLSEDFSVFTVKLSQYMSDVD